MSNNERNPKSEERRRFLVRTVTAAALVLTVDIELRHRPFRSLYDRLARENTEEQSDYWGKELSIQEIAAQIQQRIDGGSSISEIAPMSNAIVMHGMQILGQERSTAVARASRVRYEDIVPAGQVRSNRWEEPDLYLDTDLLRTNQPESIDATRAKWLEIIDVASHETVHAAPYIIENRPDIESYDVLGIYTNTVGKRYGFRTDGEFNGLTNLLSIPNAPNFLEELMAEIGRVKIMRKLREAGVSAIGLSGTVVGSQLKCRCHGFLEPALNWVYNADAQSADSNRGLSNYMLNHHLISNRADLLQGIGGILTNDSTLANSHQRAIGLTYLTGYIAKGLGIAMLDQSNLDTFVDRNKLSNFAQDLRSELVKVYQK